MDFKNLIREFELSQNNIDTQLNTLKSILKKEGEFWIELNKLDFDLLLNDKIMNLIADSLQLVNNPETLEKFDLEDVEKIYRLLIQYYPDNLRYQIDLILFLNNVMGNEKEAKQQSEKMIEMLEQKKLYINNIFD